MHQISKMFIGLSLVPAAFHAISLTTVAEGTVDLSTWIYPFSIFLGGCVLAWGFEWGTRNTLNNRVIVDLKPNLVTLSGTSFECSFSSADHFITSQGQLAHDIHAAATEALFKPNQSVGLRKAAHVRVWPGSMTITDLEMGALQAAMEEEFIDPIIEVMEQAA
ncbi:hypothetical protein H8F21_15850 [Pseudomonas sp. P66]|uniref:Uncharacterized protein n=1 Tax=Pseudomonas arcuscaelestis TaxID=2710591 RepID=A0ABS2BZI2_9PSED|nr:hypothetical protein [Pseudomonas arcuscaelestis]MBM5459042.1 hypothetical protein [Pseudomonas arcuscaelestis]